MLCTIKRRSKKGENGEKTGYTGRQSRHCKNISTRKEILKCLIVVAKSFENRYFFGMHDIGILPICRYFQTHFGRLPIPIANIYFHLTAENMTFYAYSYYDCPLADADIQYNAFQNVYSLGKIRELLYLV